MGISQPAGMSRTFSAKGRSFWEIEVSEVMRCGVVLTYFDGLVVIDCEKDSCDCDCDE